MQFDDIPLLDGAAPLIGHYHRFRTDQLSILQSVARRQQDLVRINLLWSNVTLIGSPAAVYELLVRKASSVQKSPVMRSVLHPIVGDGLFSSGGELWRRQRRLMAPIFRHKMLKNYADCMATCTEHRVRTWRDGQELDIATETTSIAMHVVGKVLFDIDTSEEADELGAAVATALAWSSSQLGSLVMNVQMTLREALVRVGTRLQSRLFASLGDRLMDASDALVPPIILPGARSRELRVAIDTLEQRVYRMIAERRAATEPGHDLLARLLTARDDTDGTAMTDTQVRDEILTLFIAGHETTASALAWSLYLLLRDPDAYRRARAEVDAVTSPRIGYGDLPRLEYCLRVFKEAMRMYPPVFAFGRETVEPIELVGYRLPLGAIVVVSPYVVHHRADVWPEPDRFEPDRFLPERELDRPRGAYIPFGDGRRSCIGNHFALMEGPIVLATLLRRANFELTVAQVSATSSDVTLRPSGGIPVRVRLRS